MHELILVQWLSGNDSALTEGDSNIYDDKSRAYTEKHFMLVCSWVISQSCKPFIMLRQIFNGVSYILGMNVHSCYKNFENNSLVENYIYFINSKKTSQMI